jgi:hypothetical protein
MKQLREQIKKEIKKLSEELGMRKYPLPTELKLSLERDLKLRPLIRYVNNVKAANTVPPSYTVFLHNGQSFSLYIEQTSIVAKIGYKSYWLMNGDETSEAIKALNRILTQPIPSSGEKTVVKLQEMRGELQQTQEPKQTQKWNLKNQRQKNQQHNGTKRGFRCNI